MEIDIIIDTLTNCLVRTETGEECDTEYRLVARTITKQDALELKARGWKFDRFGQAMTDGRLTAPSDGKVYRLREAILLSKQLGRPLSQDEMKKFEV